MGRLLDEDTVIKVLERWRKAFRENSHYVSASDLSLVVNDVRELPPAQPEKAQLSQEGTTSDLIDRQAAIDAIDKRFDSIPMDQTAEILKLRKDLRELPPAQPEPHDLVSRRAALEAMDTWDKFGCDPDGKLVRYDDDKHYIPYVHYEDMVHAVKNLPPIQPEPHEGHWIGGDGSYICSECNSSPMDFIETSGISFDAYIETPMNYCPNCGADMRGGQNGH